MLAVIFAVALAQESDPIQVVVPRRTLHPGVRIEARDLEWMRTLPEFVPVETLLTMDSATGRVVRETILPGEYIRAKRLAPVGSGEGLDTLVVAPLVRIRIAKEHAAPLIHPGATVDVVDLSSGCLAAQAVRVVGLETRDGVMTHGDGENTVAWHLAVTSEQGIRVAELADKTLLLRGDGDRFVSDVLACP